MDLKDLTGLGAAADSLRSVLGMFFPDKTEEEKGKIALALTIVQGQLEANKAEAQNPSTFVAGWRPAVGWVCVAALGMTFIPKALVLTILWTWQACALLHGWNGSAAMPALPPYPDLGVTDLIGLLMSLLGMGAMRSWDKQVGTDTKALAPRDQGGTPN